MRLIDADALIKDLGYLYTKNHVPVDMRAKETLSTIMEQPTAYDTDKVLKQMEDERKFWENAYDSDLGKEKARSYEHAIEIVKAGGKDE